MGLFERAVAVLLLHETGGDPNGALSEDPLDDGGLTKWGLSQRYHRDLDVRSLTREQAIEVYRSCYWQRGRYAELPESLAIKLFDSAAGPLGPRRSGLALQRALRACGWPVAEDGAVGPVTVASAREAPLEPLLAALRSELAGLFRLEVATDPKDARFGEGWLARAYS